MGWRSDDYDLTESAKDALSPLNILKRLFLMFIFGVVLGLKVLVHNLDLAGASGGGWLTYLRAVSMSVYSGVGLALGSAWAVIQNPVAYYQLHWWGSFLLAGGLVALLMAFFYQPVSLVINIFDGRSGQRTNTGFRILATLILVIILSAVVYFITGGASLATPLNSTILTNVTNVTQNVTGVVNGSVISLL